MSALLSLPRHERRRLEQLDTEDHESLARRRLAGEPLQYIEGTAPFADFEVKVDPRVLIPRPETEGLYELAVELMEDPKVIVDLGTGAGALAIAFARRFPRAEVHAVDVSAQALKVATENADRLGADIEFHEGDLFSALPARLEARIDVIVSNPPYVAEHEWEDLPNDVRREPREALVAGVRGTEVLERIAAGAGRWLAASRLLLCEIGETQAGILVPLFSHLGDISLATDLAGRDRYLWVRSGP